MADEKSGLSFITRDQKRAKSAYEFVAKHGGKDIRIAVNALGPNIIQLGMAAAIADLQRRGGKAKPILDFLAKSELPLGGSTSDAEALPSRIRALPVGTYMLVTRETLQLVRWLKRALQSLPEKDGQDSQQQAGGKDA